VILLKLSGNINGTKIIQKNSNIDLIYIFIICAFIGWLGEVVTLYIIFGKIVKRGVFYGPICSIYGFSVIILYFLFLNVKKNKKNILPIFLASSLALGCFELFSGLFFKYIFNIEMWTYKGNYLSILDYTTVPMIICWGILGSIYVFFIQAYLLKIISLIPKKYKYIAAYIIVIIYLIDFLFSTYNVFNNPQVLYNLVHI
jgi:uncharacterized membrane protein